MWSKWLLIVEESLPDYYCCYCYYYYYSYHLIDYSYQCLFSMFKIQINSKSDIVLSETELTDSVQNCDICINFYNVYCTDVKEKTMDWFSLPNVFMLN